MAKVASVVLNNFVNDSRVLKEGISLKNMGHDVEVIAIHDDNLEDREIISGVNVYRVKLKLKKLPKFFLVQIFKYMEFFSKTIKKIWNYDVVHCHDLSALPIGVMLKVIKKKKVKLIYDAHEFETEVINNFPNWFNKLIKVTERTLIKKVDYTITVSDSIGEMYYKMYGIKPIIIYNTPQYKENINKNDYFHQKFDLPKQSKIFLYQGSLIKERGLETLLDVFESLSVEQATLIFMGYGTLESTIKKYAEKNDNIFFHNAVPPKEILKYTSAADVGVCYVKNTCMNYYYGLPNKLFEYCMCGLPILANDLFEIEKIVTTFDCGFVFKDSKANLLDTVHKILKSDDLEKKSMNSFKVSKIYNWESQEEKLFSIYNS